MEREKDVTDEEIREVIEKAQRRISHFCDRLGKRLDVEDTAVLQAHFLLEEHLDQLLVELASQPKRLNLTLPFDAKVKILRAFAPLGDETRWEIVEAINALRNKIAHLHGRDRKHAAIQKLRELWKETDDAGGREDYDLILDSTIRALVFLSAVRYEIKERRSSDPP